MGDTIREHEGSKYLRKIFSATERRYGVAREVLGEVDVYCVLLAFGVTCPARQHAIKKLLCAGLRNKGDERADLVGALAAVQRAVELCPKSERETSAPTWEVVPAFDNGNCIGYRVRWSVPDDRGRYLWVRHYLAGEDGSPSLGWCEQAALSNAKQMRGDLKVPDDFSNGQWATDLPAQGPSE